MWEANSECAPDQHGELTALVREGVFERGLKTLEEAFA
ncbi:MAG: hypothetical protein M2R45_03136 [Verrucomicrobia subdivision 3 bacterium]|nr:hypothetical protein [Limisphaerales bacterium]MCS1413204.1 hypothetical protein [Limisphaerales bacterium]